MPENDRTAKDGAFVVTRDFNASRDLVWKAWSEPGRLSQWWGPKGCKIRVEHLEFRAGGFFHYSMAFPNAPLAWGRFMYREIAEPDRIVWLNSFSNEKGGITRAPFCDRVPLEIENTVMLTERAGATILNLRSLPFGETAEERECFERLFPSMQQGFGGTFERLALHLARG